MALLTTWVVSVVFAFATLPRNCEILECARQS